MVFESYQTKVIEEFVPWLERIREHNRLCMTTGACCVVLLLGEVTTAASYFQIVRDGSLWRRLADTNVLISRAVAGFAIDARLLPDRVVGVGLQVIIRGDLAHVAPITGCVEGVLPVLPVYRFIGLAREMAHSAGSCVEPSLLIHVVRYRQSLKSAPLHGGKEVIDILAAHCVIDPILLLAFGTSFNNPPSVARDISSVPRVSNNDLFRLRRELVAANSDV